MDFARYSKTAVTHSSNGPCGQVAARCFWPGQSRLPSWEVSSPVGWLVGTVNVAFLPIFGPVLVFGAMCFTYLTLRELNEARLAIRQEQAGPAATPVGKLLVSPSGGALRPRGRIEAIAVPLATAVQKLWAFAVPVLAYAILLCSYFDFVRPAEHDCETWRSAKHTQPKSGTCFSA